MSLDVVVEEGVQRLHAWLSPCNIDRHVVGVDGQGEGIDFGVIEKHFDSVAVIVVSEHVESCQLGLWLALVRICASIEQCLHNDVPPLKGLLHVAHSMIAAMGHLKQWRESLLVGMRKKILDHAESLSL